MIDALQEIKQNSACINDRVLNYIQYGLSKLALSTEINNKIIETYKNMRVDGFLLNRNPRTAAANIIYSIVGYDNKTHTGITKKDICMIFELSKASLTNTRLLNKFREYK